MAKAAKRKSQNNKLQAVHFHSADARFCGSGENGRRFTLDPNDVTCPACAGKDSFRISEQGGSFLESLERGSRTALLDFETETEALHFIRGVEYGQKYPNARPGAVRKIESRISFKLALRTGVLLLLAAALSASELPPAPHLSVRHDPVETYEPDQRLLIHNSPSTLHRSWIARHPHLFGLIVVGAGAGIGAGIGLSQRRGICQEVYEGQAYYGTAPCPSERRK